MIKKTDIEESIDGFVREDKSDGSQDFREKSDFGSAIVYDDAVKGMKHNRELVRKNLEPVRKASDEFAKECADRKGAGVPKTADLKAMGLSESFVEYVNENFSECHNGMLRCSNIRSAQKLAEAANRNGVRFTARRIGEGYVFLIKGNTHPMHEEAGSDNGLKVTGRPDAIAKAYDYLTKENKAIDIEKVRRDRNGITVTGLGAIPEKALADDLKDRFGVECSGNGLSEMLNLGRYCRENYIDEPTGTEYCAMDCNNNNIDAFNSLDKAIESAKSDKNVCRILEVTYDAKDLNGDTQEKSAEEVWNRREDGLKESVSGKYIIYRDGEKLMGTDEGNYSAKVTDANKVTDLSRFGTAEDAKAYLQKYGRKGQEIEIREDYAKTHFHHFKLLKVTGSPEEVKKVYDYLTAKNGPNGTVIVDKDEVTETYDKGFIFVYDLVPELASEMKEELEDKFNVEATVLFSRAGVGNYQEDRKRTHGLDSHNIESGRTASDEFVEGRTDRRDAGASKLNKIVKTLDYTDEEDGMNESDNDDSVSSLDPQYDARKSFYHKAKVVTFKDGREVLYSYGTPVCRIGKDGKAVLLTKGYYGWGSSATTLRHVKEFLRQHGLRADSSSQIGRDYPTEQAEVDESLGRKDGNYQVVMWECDECRRPDYDSETDCGRFDTLSEAIGSARSYDRNRLNEEYAVLDNAGNVVRTYYVPAGKDVD